MDFHHSGQGHHQEQKHLQSSEKKSWGFKYDHYYKLLFILPAILLLGSLAYIGFFYSQHGDIFYKDVSLTGGTTITVFNSTVSLSSLEKSLKPKFGDVEIRDLTDFSTGKQVGVYIVTKANQTEVKLALENILGYTLDSSNSNTEFSGSSLSSSFYNQLLWAMTLAFIFMAAVVFILFRKFLPSTYVVLSAFTDIIVTLAITDIMGLKVSTAGIAAFLMLIGYSVDTDILLTNRVLKRVDEEFDKRVFGALKTGLTMTLASFFAVLIAYFLIISPILKQVFLILSIGLAIDMISTWCMNASLLKWDDERKNKQAHQHHTQNKAN